MAEGTYEYECMRAELLGIDPPNKDEFLRKKAEEEANKCEEEEVDTENLKEAEAQGEDLKNISGGLDELNNILSMTQKKIDRFKVRCGSITSLLKLKVGSLGGEGASSSSSSSSTANAEEGGERNSGDGEEAAECNEGGNGDELSEEQSNGAEIDVDVEKVKQRKSDLSKAMDNHVNKLDAMLEKAEKAEMSMQHQTKQMKKFLH